jgi:hypothetical protein
MTRIILLVGDYGSGKTEVAVNLAFRIVADEEARPAGERSRVAIADLDLVNPYFRCREARELLEAAGVRVVMPRSPEGHEFADLPILLPEVKGLVQDAGTRAILDVGGDEVGARVLATLAPFVPRSDRSDGRGSSAADPAAAAPLGFWFVCNASRPFNDTVAGVLAAIDRIERASALRVTGLVANTHLMQETTPELVLGGVRLAEEVAAARGLALELVTAMEPVMAELPPEAFSHPRLALRRLMVPPWVRPDAAPRLGPPVLRSRNA